MFALSTENGVASVHHQEGVGLMTLRVTNDSTGNEAVSLIRLSQAIKLARAILLAAGVTGNVEGNVTRYTFID